MIRAEARALFWRWREVIAALTVMAITLWMALTFFGFMAYLGWALVAVMAVVTYAAVQRARFKAPEGGRGLVEVDEGVVSYLLPHGGGQVEIAELTAVTLLPADRGPAFWQLEAVGQSPLLIPLDAFGADKLFDVFVSLKGIETERMLRQIKAEPKQPVVIWRNRTVTLH